MKQLVVFSVALLVLSCSAPKGTEFRSHDSIFNRPYISPSPVGWVEATLQSMTLREKAAQLFIIWTRAGYYPNDAKVWQENIRFAQEIGVGGFYFSHGSAYGFPVNANKLQRASKLPLLMTVDFEWGAGMRIQEATTFPRAMALGATRDTNLAYAAGRAIAREARALGIHQIYSPVVDINNNPKNPIINTRSFGESPELVAAFARSFIRGSQDERIIATVKHFPGHGDTEVDTHLDLPTVHFSRNRFDSLELAPFKDAIANGVMSVMIGHIHASAFDESDSIPSTASVKVTTGLLRNELKFDGMIVTDALAMKGISKIYSPGEAAKRAFMAGSDVLLMSPDTDAGIDSIVSAVKRGEISMERLDHSVRKMLTYKQWCGLDTNRFVNVNAVAGVVAIGEHHALAKTIARNSITVLGNERNILPLRNLNGKKIIDIVFSDTEDPDTADDLHDELFKRKRMELIRIDPRSNQMEFDDLEKKIQSADLLICQFMFFTRPEAMTGLLPKKIAETMNAIVAMNKPVIAISMGNPYIITEVPTPEAYVVTYGTARASLDAAAEVIFGEQPAVAKLPITIPGKYRFGDGADYGSIVLRSGTPSQAGFDPDSLAKVDAVIENAIEDSAFPGAVLLVAKNGIIAHEKGYGHFTYDPSSERMTTDAIFDLASVTKVIATTSAVMKLVDEKKISLDDPVVKYFPAFGQNGKEKITIYNLLVHNSGLQAWRKYYEFCDSPQCVLDSIFVAPLVYQTGDSTIYSDMGLITTGKIIEKVTGTSLANYVDSIFLKPMGMKNTMFNPPAAFWNRLVPTEIDSFWKKTYAPVRGRVHDENAATLGGISGHAGLFSTASDLAKILQMELNYGMYNGKRYLDSATIALFTKQQNMRSSRGIGWDTRSSGRSFSGQFTSLRTFLHTGFTGTSVVVDPEKNVIIIFLTNRVYPTRNVLKISRVRPLVHDAVLGAIR
ncbi:MAG: glycoside hydrolase family 3 N-terminal domain-containing protein [Bacteriovoracaceae bacterium]